MSSIQTLIAADGTTQIAPRTVASAVTLSNNMTIQGALAAANGIATLDANGKLSESQRPSNLVNLKNIKTELDSTCITNTDYYLGYQSNVVITLPNNASIGDNFHIVFYSGATATILQINGEYLGDLPVIKENQRVELDFLYDNINWCLFKNIMEVA